MTEIVDHELTLARRLAYKTAQKWPAVEAEDLSSELTLWLFENREAVARYREEEGGEGKLYVALRRHASKICAKEQTIRSGAPLDHDAEYTVGQVERAMPFVFEDVVQSSVAVDPSNGALVGGSTYSGDYGVAMAVLMDMRGAYADMPPEVKLVLALRFRDGLTYDEIADLTGCSKRTAIRRVARAVQRVRDHLCGYV